VITVIDMDVLEIICPVCKTVIEAEEWCGGECSNCGNDYSFDEECSEDYSDCWSVVVWCKSQ